MATTFESQLSPDELDLLRAHPGARRGLASGQHLHWYLSALLFVVVVGVWQFVSTNRIVHEIILPAPTSILSVAPRVLGESLFLVHLGYTLREIFGGFVLGAGVGLLMGMLFALSEGWRKTFYPYVVAFQATPRIVLAPLILAWFGFGSESKIVQAAVGCFFPVFLNALVGLSLYDENAYKLMRSMRASRWQTFRKLRFPNALPTIFAGIKVSLTFATIGVLVSEFIGAEYGLGYELIRYHVELRIPQMYVMIVVVGLLGIGLFLTVEWVDRKVIFWRHDDTDLSKLR